MSELFRLMGFVLAHACWIVVTLPKGEILAPFAIVEESDGRRRLAHFEAEAQAEAVQKGKAFLAKPPSNAVRIASVRDGLLRRDDGTATDVLSGTGWERSKPEVTVSQTYLLDDQRRFRRLGAPFVSAGAVRDEARAIEDLPVGIGDHSEAASLRSTWGETGKAR